MESKKSSIENLWWYFQLYSSQLMTLFCQEDIFRWKFGKTDAHKGELTESILKSLCETCGHDIPTIQK
jgi:hypothetical protein